MLIFTFYHEGVNIFGDFVVLNLETDLCFVLHQFQLINMGVDIVRDFHTVFFFLTKTEK